MYNLTLLHDVLFEILLEIDKICEKNGIKYSLAYGTLIGAVRHKDFIPWDDDADILMTRENYNKFIKVIENDMSFSYFCQRLGKEQGYPYGTMRIRKNGTAFILPQWVNSELHQGIFVDVIPFDLVPENKVVFIIERYLLILFSLLRRTKNKFLFTHDENGSFSKKRAFLYFLLKPISFLIPSSLEQNLIVFCSSLNSSEYAFFSEGTALFHMSRDMKPFSKNILENYTKLFFRNKELMVVSDYDVILEHWYGDYMQLPPESERTVYHNPLVFDAQTDYSICLEALQ